MSETKLDRILFNVGPKVTLYERRTGNHYNIVPSGSVPIRRRPGGVSNQRSLLAAVEKIMKDRGPHAMPFASHEIVGLLTDLFTISDHLHWGELIDRMPADDYHRNYFEFSKKPHHVRLIDKHIAVRNPPPFRL